MGECNHQANAGALSEVGQLGERTDVAANASVQFGNSSGGFAIADNGTDEFVPGARETGEDSLSSSVDGSHGFLDFTHLFVRQRRRGFVEPPRDQLGEFIAV